MLEDAIAGRPSEFARLEQRRAIGSGREDGDNYGFLTAEAKRLPPMGDTHEERFGDDNSVRQCLEIMKEISTEQRARARHLDTKTGALAGFCATILTLNATLGRPLLRADFPAGAQLEDRRSRDDLTVQPICSGAESLLAGTAS